MKRANNNGFVMLYVVMILLLIGLAMVLLSYSSKIMAFESSTAVLEANCRNILASSLTWAEHNSQKLLQLGQDATVQLDISSLGISRSACQIAVKKIEAHQLQIEISVSCIRGKRRLVRDAEYMIR
jgi:hypothetical protein